MRKLKMLKKISAQVPYENFFLSIKLYDTVKY